MANVLFKKGNLTTFEEKVLGKKRLYDENDQFIGYDEGYSGEANVTEGALYLTEDEGCLYLGLKDNEVKRIQGSVVICETLEEFTKNILPPYSSDIIYFISGSNALVHWNPEKEVEGKTEKGGWDQLNAPGVDWSVEINGIKNRLDLAEKDIIGHTGLISAKLDTSDFNAFTESYTQTVNSFSKSVSELITADEGLTGEINKLKISDSGLDSRIKILEGKEHITSANVTDYIASLDLASKNYVAGLIAANDAMTFCGVIDGENALPTTGPIQKGATYKVGALGTYASIAAKVGDLIIYNGNDITDTTTAISSSNWVHISSGYEDDYNQKFDAELVNNIIYLTDGIGTGSGHRMNAIQFTSSTLVPKTQLDGTNFVISLDQVWGTFD